jgi:cytochrome c551/c552
MYPKATRLPEYYNKKVFFYDWIRGWIKVLTLLPNGDLDNMEPFMAGTKFNSAIDMETGPDGRIYVLEYGSGWFSKNKDAGLARIDYNTGNRAPEVTNITANKAYGKLPLTVIFKVAAVDPEHDKMTYTWDMGNGVKKHTQQPVLSYTFTKKAKYNVSVEVADEQGASSKSKIVSVLAGSDSQFLVNKLALEKANSAGQALMMSLDCKACHKANEKSVGPAFADVAKKYAKSDAATDKLTQKIIKGGHGNWGDVDMPAHPALKPDEAKKILNWIYSLK